MEPGKVRLVMLAMPQLSANLDIVQRLADNAYEGLITAVASHSDELEILQEAGVHAAYDAFAEAGAGFAGHVQERFADDLASHRELSP